MPVEGRTLTSGVLSKMARTRVIGDEPRKHLIRSGPFRGSSIVRRRRSLPSASTCSTTRSAARTSSHHAYALARANAGAPGVDGMTFEQIEASGVEAWLAGLREDLVAKTYRPHAGAAGDDPEAGRRRTPARHPDDPGSGGSNRRQARAGADLRGGLRGQCLWLSSAAQRGRCGQGSAPADLPGLYRCRGRRSVEIFRHDPACGPPANRWPDASSTGMCCG